MRATTINQILNCCGTSTLHLVVVGLSFRKLWRAPTNGFPDSFWILFPLTNYLHNFFNACCNLVNCPFVTIYWFWRLLIDGWDFGKWKLWIRSKYFEWNICRLLLWLMLEVVGVLGVCILLWWWLCHSESFCGWRRLWWQKRLWRWRGPKGWRWVGAYWGLGSTQKGVADWEKKETKKESEFH